MGTLLDVLLALLLIVGITGLGLLLASLVVGGLMALGGPDRPPKAARGVADRVSALLLSVLALLIIVFMLSPGLLFLGVGAYLIVYGDNTVEHMAWGIVSGLLGLLILWWTIRVRN